VILPVRPHFFFDMLPADSPPFVIPVPKRDTGSPTQLELTLLLAIGRIVNAGRTGEVVSASPLRGIWQFGTFKGQTALALAENFRGNADGPCVHTLDLNLELSAETLRHADVEALEGHSMAFDYSDFAGRFPFVFIDGGHDEQTVYSDSLVARDQLWPKEGPAAIVWHDYSDDWPGVCRAVDRFFLSSPWNSFYHVEETSLVVHLRKAKDAGAPFIMENVREAQRYIGPAAWHYGSRYLWGDVPAIMPYAEKSRKEHLSSSAIAQRAEIPFDLARHIACCFKPRKAYIA
jgi:hypothetical protein